MSDDKDFTPKGEEDIRQEIIEEYDFDEEADKERIDKLTKRELEHQENLGTAIRQKKSQREQREAREARLRELGYDPETGEKAEKGDNPEKKDQPSKEADKEKDELREELDQIKMDQAGEFSEDIQKEIRRVAKLEGISYKQAAKTDYVQFQIDKEKKKENNDNASLGDGKGTRTVPETKIADVKPDEFKNLSDEDWQKKKEQIRKEG